MNKQNHTLGMLMSISQLADAEYQFSSTAYNKQFASIAEGYAVLKEEIEEASEEVNKCHSNLAFIWDSLRQNKPKDINNACVELSEAALKGALELIQVAAMCYKMHVTTDVPDTKAETPAEPTIIQMLKELGIIVKPL